MDQPERYVFAQSKSEYSGRLPPLNYRMEADGGVRVPGAGKNGITAERVEQERELIQDVAACVLSGQSLNGVATEWRQRGIHTLRATSGHHRTSARCS
jgi:hypothetical protein